MIQISGQEHPENADEGEVTASGNLAAPRRTAMAVLEQAEFLGIERQRLAQFFQDAGLPARALDEPDFPISFQQELTVINGALSQLPAGRSALGVVFELAPLFGVHTFGVLGLAMLHAPDYITATSLPLTYPQLAWGHCRLVATRRDEAFAITYTMERPALEGADDSAVERLVQYCTALDLLSTVSIWDDLSEGPSLPLRIALPWRQPADLPSTDSYPGCPIQWQAGEARLVFPRGLEETAPRYANPRAFQSYTATAERLSLLLADDITVTEQVTRWLWTYTPPLSRREIAGHMNSSERNLSRQLAKEGTSYQALLGEVQAERARHFLRNPGLSVSSIAYRLGYSDPAAFSRAFTGWTGVSPLAWRRREAA